MTDLATTNTLTSLDIERVLITGDLSKLTPDQRVKYYNAVCKSIGLNPLTRPFDYITLNGRLTLYAKKDATDQLRKLNSVSIGKPDIQFQDDLIVVTVSARNGDGREDSDIGVVRKSDMRGDVANAIMKAVTKAKRRVTLSLCGLGWLDETEVETIPDARPVAVADTGEIVDGAPSAQTAHSDPPASVPKPGTGELKNGNGKRGKQASLRIPANHFIAFCETFAQKYPDYRLPTGDPDRAHVLYTATAIGYPEINPNNWDVVMEMLDRHAQGLPTQVPLS